MSCVRPSNPRYDVALSFAGEERSYVGQVAEGLKESGVKVFYDDYEKISLWGKDLYSHLDYIYREASRYCILFVSESYERKVWTNHERQSAQARAFEENLEYVLPVRFDSTAIPGLRPTIGYLDLSETSPGDLVSQIMEKLGPKKFEPVFPVKINALYKAMELKGGKRKNPRRWDDVRDVARAFYDALGRMNEEERRAVAGVLVYGCGAELPEHIHVSLDLVRRMTGLAAAQVVSALGSVRSLGLTSALRNPEMAHGLRPGEILGDERDLTLSFNARTAMHVRDSTTIAFRTAHLVAGFYCDKHSIDELVRLNFQMLGDVKHQSGCRDKCHAGVEARPVSSTLAAQDKAV